MERKQTLEPDAMNNSNKFGHPAHHDGQQQQAAASAATAVKQHTTEQQHQAAEVHGRYIRIYTRTSCSSVRYTPSNNYNRLGPGTMF